MAKSSSSSDKKMPPEIEFHSDAMERFERAVDVVAKSPPQHRGKKPGKKTKRAKAKKRS